MVCNDTGQATDDHSFGRARGVTDY